MIKIVFIGAGSHFGATSFADIMSFPELRDSEVVLVDINPDNLAPIEAYCRKVVEHYKAPTRVVGAVGWRDGILDGANYVITSFAQGGPAYAGPVYCNEITLPREYGIYQNVGDTVGLAGVLRMMRTAPEILAIAQDMERRCPGAYLLNYVNPMAMLTRAMALNCPRIHMVGLCHNIQYGIRGVARWLGVSHKELRYCAAGINHMDWFLRLEYLDGRNAYPDVLDFFARNEDARGRQAVHYELLKHFGCLTTESKGHCAEYLPYFMPRQQDREEALLNVRELDPNKPYGRRTEVNADLAAQVAGEKPLFTERSFEYGAHIMHSLETDTVHRMHLNVINDDLIENLPKGYCVEVPCTADRTGLHPQRVGRLPIPLAALCRGMADMQTLASDAFLERDIEKACQACQIDPLSAASATPARIRECFTRLLKAERPLLEPYWEKGLNAWLS
jgi:alpha-galactosidase